MTSHAIAVEAIDLDNPDFISRYGAEAVKNGTHGALLRQLEESPMHGLANAMSIILKATQMPVEKPGRGAKTKIKSALFGWLIGADLMSDVEHHASTRNLPAALQRAKTQSEGLRAFIQTAATSRADLTSSIKQLEHYLEAGENYLREHPEAGTADGHGIASLSSRERFIRKLANLRALHTSHLLSIEQLKLAVAQATDMLDRYDELVDVLLPIYRQYEMAKANKKFLAPHAVALAVQTHEHIQATVSESLKALSAPVTSIRSDQT